MKLPTWTTAVKGTEENDPSFDAVRQAAKNGLRPVIEPLDAAIQGLKLAIDNLVVERSARIEVRRIEA